MAPPSMPSAQRPKLKHPAFTLLEVLIAMTILAVMMGFFAVMIDNAASTWTRGESRVENYQAGRAALELIGREIKGATVDSRTQFAIADSDILISGGNGVSTALAPNATPDSHTAFWVAPLGENGELCQVGYYTERDDGKRLFRLKRLFIPQKLKDPTTGVEDRNPYFPHILIDADAAYAQSHATTDSNLFRPDHLTATWLLNKLDPAAFDDSSISTVADAQVSTMADGVLAFWVQALDQQMNPIPSLMDEPDNHQTPTHPLHFNSAAFWTQANTGHLEAGIGAGNRTFLYLKSAQNPGDTRPKALRGNRVPAAIEVALVLIDQKALGRINLSADLPANSTFIATKSDINGDVMDIQTSIRNLTDHLTSINIREYRVFTTRIKLLNGGA